MPTSAHQIPLIVFHDHPELLLALLQKELVRPLAPFDRVEDRSNDLSVLRPVELRADQVLVFYNAAQPVMAMVIEVQSRPDAKKLRSWPAYVGELVARLGCPVYLVITTGDEATAVWAAEPNPFFHPCSPFVPLVLGPQEIPAVTTVAQAAEEKDLALLSLAVHGSGRQGDAVAIAVVDMARNAEHEYKILCMALLMQLLNEARRKNLEKRLGMDLQTWLRDNRDELVRGAYEYGKRVREQECVAAGVGRTLQRLWQQRFGPVDSALSARIQQETREEILDQWVDQFGVAATTADAAALREHILATPAPRP